MEIPISVPQVHAGKYPTGGQDTKHQRVQNKLHSSYVPGFDQSQGCCTSVPRKALGEGLRSANKGEFETEASGSASFAPMPSDSHSYLFSSPGF